jgi:hypothetical protein
MDPVVAIASVMDDTAFAISSSSKFNASLDTTSNAFNTSAVCLCFSLSACAAATANATATATAPTTATRLK